MKRITFAILMLLILSVTACLNEKGNFIAFDNERIEYMGRVGMNERGFAEIYWPGSSIKIHFEGTGIKALLKDEHGKNYFNVIIDEDSILILKPDTVQKIYTLARGLSPGLHTVELFKRTGWNRGKTLFYGFKTGKKTNILDSDPQKERNIEFYGNSITAGYAVEDYSGNDSRDSTFTNNYRSYANLTARHFNAEYSCIARGGIGIMVSWYPLIMPEMYNRLDPEDEYSIWDFSKFTPEVVVVNLFQNDSWIVELNEYEEFQHRFGTEAPDEDFIIDSYSSFLRLLRDKYPESHIICMLGNMDITREVSPWPGYVEKAVAGMEDKKMYTLFVPFKQTPGHPRIEEQAEMANKLIDFIEDKIDW
ncbi:MAG: electron transporter RnfD [Bacteroidota bacterium]|nr:electron transporter RnfD [Bacteroidota bacterium]